ncbi:MAG TPA: VanW family protein [Anaerolineales bacterium]|nr:VanW family protein [Anaerolineales bacterium]
MKPSQVIPSAGKAQRLALGAGLSLASAAAVAVAGALVLVLGSRLIFAGRALPGVNAAGLDLGGMKRAEIEQVLGAALGYPQLGALLLGDQGQHWTAHPAELGVAVDVAGMADRALAVGRSGNLLQSLAQQLTAWNQGYPVPAVVVFDQAAGAAYLQRLAAQIDRPQIEASLGVDGLEIEMRPGQIGRRLDIQANLQALTPFVASMHDTSLELMVEETPPLVLDASEQAALARSIVEQPLTLQAEGAGPWVLDPQMLAGMLRFNLVQNSQGAQYQVGLDPAQLAAFLEPLAPELERRPQNARFIFNDDTHQLDLHQEAVVGRNLDIPASLQAIESGLQQGRHQLDLVFQLEQPTVPSTATAAELGITQAVSVVSTYFGGSSPERVNNIRTASSAFHGLLVAPGETLAMGDVLGDISLDKGYSEALIIFGDRTIKGVGGGVCQVSTTLFRAAFMGGFEIVERYPHAYRVGYYEQGPGSPGPGLDATVFVPLVDFRFTNDTPHWLLMETYIYGTQLLWKFYSSSDGRQVQVSGPRISNEVDAPEPLYKENSELDEGEIEQVDYQADGMDVVVTRTVTRDGQILHEDVVKTHYLPWRAIFEYGPGTELPEDAITEED